MVILTIGTVLLAACAVGVAYPLLWTHHSDAGGQALLRQARRQDAITSTPKQGAVAPSVKATCKPGRVGSESREPTLPAIISVPTLGLQAPVLQGLSDAVLSDAVGHDASSVWPGSKGISVLLAHDVSYFSS
ncbi:MAG: hypothetical protein ABSG36_19375, partial [Acidimicrobiales bacterium]